MGKTKKSNSKKPRSNDRKSNVDMQQVQQVASKVAKKSLKTQRGRRIEKERAPKVIENTKRLLALKGPKSSEVIKSAIKDIYKLKNPDSVILTKRNLTRPFEDPTSINFLSDKNDCSLFVYGSHSKKRAHNIIFGRCFNYEIMDMIEFGVDADTFKSMAQCSSGREGIARVDSKPLMIFQGEEFEVNPDFIQMKSLFLDMFRGQQLSKINIAALDRIIIIRSYENKLYFRNYCLLLKKSGTKFPRIELEEVGPTMDLTFRRRFTSDELLKQAMKQPKAAKVNLGKNIELGQLNDTLGRIYTERQNTDEIAIKKMKGLKRRRDDENEASDKPSQANTEQAEQPKKKSNK